MLLFHRFSCPSFESLSSTLSCHSNHTEHQTPTFSVSSSSSPGTCNSICLPEIKCQPTLSLPWGVGGGDWYAGGSACCCPHPEVGLVSSNYGVLWEEMVLSHSCPAVCIRDSSHQTGSPSSPSLVHMQSSNCHHALQIMQFWCHPGI